MAKFDHIMAQTPEAAHTRCGAQKQAPAHRQFINSPEGSRFHLQRMVGNQAMSRLVRSGALQAKLAISQPGDRYEQEADRVAEQVMRMPEPRLQRQPDEEQIQMKPLAEQITPLIERQAEPEKEEEEESLQAKEEMSNQTPTVTPTIESQINALRGGGQPLDPATRAYFEPRFGRDFSGVRVHTDAQAAESAQAVKARAFTVGRDVVFGAGQYVTQTVAGRCLLAHELTHVMQQLTLPESTLCRQVTNSVDKKVVSDEFTRKIIEDEIPLKLVFYDTEGYNKEDTDFFAFRGREVAQAIQAICLPIQCPKDRAKLKLTVGAMGFTNKEILPLLQKAEKCIGRKVNEIHLIGHLAAGMKFENAAKYARYTSPDIRVIFHGCSVSTDYPKELTKLLGKLGTQAQVFAHSTTGEAGRPYDFFRITLPEGKTEIETEEFERVTSILPASYIRTWASMWASYHPDEFYQEMMFSGQEIPEDTKEIVREMFIERTIKEIQNGSKFKLNALKKILRLSDKLWREGTENYNSLKFVIKEL